MLTKRAPGMGFTSRAVSPNTHRIFSLDQYTNPDPFLDQRQEEFYYKLEQAKQAES